MERGLQCPEPHDSEIERPQAWCVDAQHAGDCSGLVQRARFHVILRRGKRRIDPMRRKFPGRNHRPLKVSGTFLTSHPVVASHIRRSPTQQDASRRYRRQAANSLNPKPPFSCSGISRCLNSGTGTQKNTLSYTTSTELSTHCDICGSRATLERQLEPVVGPHVLQKR